MNPIASARYGEWLIKVPAVTLSFWIVKILCTTVGETGADYLAVGVGLGQGLTRAMMASLLAVALVWQLRTQRYTPWIYWLTVVLVSVVGVLVTSLAFLTRTYRRLNAAYAAGDVNAAVTATVTVTEGTVPASELERRWDE